MKKFIEILDLADSTELQNKEKITKMSIYIYISTNISSELSSWWSEYIGNMCHNAMFHNFFFSSDSSDSLSSDRSCYFLWHLPSFSC